MNMKDLPFKVGQQIVVRSTANEDHWSEAYIIHFRLARIIEIVPYYFETKVILDRMDDSDQEIAVTTDEIMVFPDGYDVFPSEEIIKGDDLTPGYISDHSEASFVPVETWNDYLIGRSNSIKGYLCLRKKE